MPGNRSGKYGSRGNRIDSDERLAELQGDLHALYEMYRRGEIPERVVRLVHQLEDAYWDARLAENGDEGTAGFGEPKPRDKSN